MKIAQIAPIIERVPPKKYGGTERVIHTLTEHLIKMGHEVTLFASGDSITSARLESVFPVSMREQGIKDLYGLNEWPLLHFGVAYDRQDGFDIIHDHNWYYSLPTANLARTPTVLTYHGPFTINQKRMFSILNKPYVVTISKAQLPFPEEVNHLGTVYHGLDMTSYPFSNEHEGYLLFVGRTSEEKGLHLAIEVALAINKPLKVVAKQDEIDSDHYKNHIEPYLEHELIEWIGEVDEHARNELMSKAMCLLHPVGFREPFGLTLIEAMACGSPVIAFRRGSIPEVVVDGKTGFIVEDVVAMAEAVGRIDKINREDCRKHALTHFNGERMTQDYVRLYEKILKQKNKSRNGVKQRENVPLNTRITAH